MTDLQSRLAAGLAARTRLGLRRELRPRGPDSVPRVDVNGRRLINFAANDYLGLASHPRVNEALAGGAKRWGAGAGASHLLSGHTRAHAAFEKTLADFLECERALLFSTGYMANLGVIGALAGRGDSVIEDRLSHASLLDAAVLSRARLLRYAHADIEAARNCLGRAAGRRLLATDAVFSMDGDIAPLANLVQLTRETDAVLVVDDAHGFGVLGNSGRGTLEHLGIGSAEVPARVVTFGKALGVFGAAVVGSRNLIETLVNHARTYVYTTAFPPALAVALGAALAVLRAEDWRREKLREHIARFRDRARTRGLPLADSSTPIQPVLLGQVDIAVAMARLLETQGYYVPAIRPPTVPEGSARLRISLSAAHETAQIEGLVCALAQAFDAHG